MPNDAKPKDKLRGLEEDESLPTVDLRCPEDAPAEREERGE